MTTVEVLFQNIQSHENTSFVLKPGINFILADGNNVGKSTIFKVLSRMAKAPNVNGSKLASLIRYGYSEAVAAFKFDGERVIAKFTQYERESAKVFFEHIHSDGEITRSVFCPKSLLDALGIVVSEQGDIINFNDANSVQLISEISPEADTIITHVMLDPKVEALKHGIYTLGREVNSDIKKLEASVGAYNEALDQLSYLPIVDEFFESKDKLEVMCRIGDGLPDMSTSKCVLPGLRELELVKSLLNVVGEMSTSIFSTVSIPDGYGRYSQIFAVAKKLEPLGQLSYRGVDEISSDLDLLRITYSVASAILSAMRNAEQVQSYNRRLTTLSEDMSAIESTLSSVSRRVICPVKGEVLYTDEKCISCGDRFTLCCNEGAQA